MSIPQSYRFECDGQLISILKTLNPQPQAVNSNRLEFFDPLLIDNHTSSNLEYILAHLNPLIVCVQRNIVATPYDCYGRSCQCKSFYTAEAHWIENKFCIITSSHGLGLLCQILSFQKWREIPGVLHYNIYLNQ
jgi:hypothetical protein